MLGKKIFIILRYSFVLSQSLIVSVAERAGLSLT